MRGGYRLSPQPILAGLTTHPVMKAVVAFNAGGAIYAEQRGLAGGDSPVKCIETAVRRGVAIRRQRYSQQMLPQTLP